MNDTDLERALRAHFTDLVAEAPTWPEFPVQAAVPTPTPSLPSRWTRARVSLAAAASVLAVVGTAAMVGQSLNDSPTGSPAGDPTQPVVSQPSAEPDEALQMRLQAIAEHYSAFEGAPGYGKTVIDAEFRRISVFWHGQVPVEVTDLAVQDSTDGITVRFVSATYSAAQFDEVADLVWEATRPPGGAELVATYPSEDMSRLIVEVAGTDLSQARSQLEGDVSGDFAIPLEVVLSEGATAR